MVDNLNGEGNGDIFWDATRGISLVIGDVIYRENNNHGDTVSSAARL